jgi:MFS family permease
MICSSDVRRVRPGVVPPDRVRQLLLFFGAAYFMQGIAQTGALIDQPLTHYLMTVHHMDAAQVASRLAILVLPWTIKPLYGLISDFLPLAGYRRKTYLQLTGLLATLGFLWVTNQLTGPVALQGIVAALLLTSFGIAFSDVLVDAVMVEQGKALNATRPFQATQWLWINVAGIVSALGGGLLTQYLPSGSSVAMAAGLVSLAPLAVGVAGWILIPDTRASVNVARFQSTGRSLLLTLRSRRLWIVLAFLALWKFSPSLGKPLYAHMTGTLGFSESFFGLLSALSNAGAVVGALLFPRLTRRLSGRRTLLWAVGLNVVSVLAYLLLQDRWTGAAISIATGVTEMLVQLALLDLAARACAKDAEGFSFAALMSVLNLASQGSAILGARLYVGVFHNHLTPLILVSAVTTLLVYPLLSHLPDDAPSNP